MNDRCTPATARRLKEQGFDQPVPAPGQVWYTANDTPFIIIACNAESAIIGWVGVTTSVIGTTRNTALPSCAYAYSAPDILREIAHEYTLAYVPEDKQYFCCTTDEETGNLSGYMNKNPAEACAEAWEAKQKQG